jgi:hypothetical protein
VSRRHCSERKIRANVSGFPRSKSEGIVVRGQGDF